VACVIGGGTVCLGDTFFLSFLSLLEIHTCHAKILICPLIY